MCRLWSPNHGIKEFPRRHGDEFTFGEGSPLFPVERNTGNQQHFLETGTDGYSARDDGFVRLRTPALQQKKTRVRDLTGGRLNASMTTQTRCRRPCRESWRGPACADRRQIPISPKSAFREVAAGTSDPKDSECARAMRRRHARNPLCRPDGNGRMPMRRIARCRADPRYVRTHAFCPPTGARRAAAAAGQASASAGQEQRSRAGFLRHCQHGQGLSPCF